MQYFPGRPVSLGVRCPLRHTCPPPRRPDNRHQFAPRVPRLGTRDPKSAHESPHPTDRRRADRRRDDRHRDDPTAPPPDKAEPKRENPRPPPSAHGPDTGAGGGGRAKKTPDRPPRRSGRHAGRGAPRGQGPRNGPPGPRTNARTARDRVAAAATEHGGEGPPAGVHAQTLLRPEAVGGAAQPPRGKGAPRRNAGARPPRGASTPHISLRARGRGRPAAIRPRSAPPPPRRYP